MYRNRYRSGFKGLFLQLFIPASLQIRPVIVPDQIGVLYDFFRFFGFVRCSDLIDLFSQRT